MRRLNSYGPSMIVLGTAIVVLLAGPGAVRRLTYAQTEARIVQASERLESNPILGQLNQAYRDIASFVEPSVAHISAQHLVHDGMGNPIPGRMGISSGSGWVYDAQGHIVTNEHVIEDAQAIDVQLHTGELRRAELVGRDRNTDIAVIKISGERLHPAQLGADADVKQGDIVFAFGSPFEFRFSMSKGVVSGLGRHAGLVGITYEDFIQVDAAINPGNSGGPLTDIHGRVIGMNTAIATGRGASVSDAQFAGIGLAIPISIIRRTADQLIASGEVSKGYLGVERDEGRTMATARAKGFTGQGFGVSRVVPNGPAALAGVLAGDIITHIDDRPIDAAHPRDAFLRLRSLIASKSADDEVTLTIWRFDEHEQTGRTLTVRVTLVELDPSLYAGRTPDILRRLGLAKLTTSTRAKARDLGIPYRRGVIIESVTPDSPYDGILQPGWIIEEVDRRPVANLDEFYIFVSTSFSDTAVADITLVGTDGHRERVKLTLLALRSGSSYPGE